MRDKYEALKNSEEAECPTCEQPIDFDFITKQYDAHNDTAKYMLSEIKKTRKDS